MRTIDLSEIMLLVENMIITLVTALEGSGMREELIHAHRRAQPSHAESSRLTDLIERRWQGLRSGLWPRITYRNAIHLLCEATEAGNAHFQHEPRWTTGLQLEHERFVAETVGHGSPVFVTDYPKEIKPFYMSPSTFEKGDDSVTDKTVSCFDLLLPEMCETVGGSLREHRLHSLIENMHDHGMDIDEDHASHSAASSDVPSSTRTNTLDWYVDLRRFGSVPHGGFGLGFDRLLGYLAGLNNIKDVVPWPRYYGRCDC